MIFPSDKKWIIALMMFQKYMWIYINIFWPVHKILKTINFNKKIIKIINKCNISGEVYALDDVQLKKMQTMWSRVRHSNKSRVSCIHICRCVAAPSYTESMVHTRLDDRRRWQPIVLFLSVTVPPPCSVPRQAMWWTAEQGGVQRKRAPADQPNKQARLTSRSPP